jgi:MscS family membrane protein
LEMVTGWLEALVPLNEFWRQVIVAAVIFLFFLALRGFFTRVILRVVLSLTRRTKTDIDDHIVLALEHPLKTLIMVIGIYLALTCLPLYPAADLVINRIYRSLILILVAWALYNISGRKPFQDLTDKFKMDPVLVDFLAKVFRFVIVALALLMVADVWGYPITGLLTGLGLGGLAIALAAQDAVSNIFGGIVIILDKPFSVGDWIYTPSVEGTVEEVSFRSTKIRTFAQALITMPNSKIANEPITNWTRMGKRRIKFNLRVAYSTPRDKLRRCVERIREMLHTHPEIHKETIFVTFDEFGDSSLDIFLYFFTKTTVWAEYLKVKEDVNFKIMEILEQEGVSVALPGRSIYIENGEKD